jgi:hypothetical protein
MSDQRAPEEIQRAFDTLYKSILSFCKLYDSGETWYAGWIATAVHSLVQDHGKSYKSVLTQLGLSSPLRFLSSGRMPENAGEFAWSPLVGMSVSESGNEYHPQFGRGPQGTDHGAWDHRYVQFTRWWDKEIIFKGAEYSFTRKGLVFALRNKEGFGHFGNLDDPRYNEMKNDKRVTGVKSGGELAVMRQIGWEITKTFERRE